MLQLPSTELVIFLLAIGFGCAAAIVGFLQLRAQSHTFYPYLTHLVCTSVLLQAVFLVFRAAELKAVPLTSLFESLLVLSLVVGLTYILFGLFFQQVWFGSVMSWILLALLILAAGVAEPAEPADAIETRPLAIAHGLAMALGAAMILLASAAAYLFLLGQRRLKKKEFDKVLGRVPNLQRLQKTHLLALRAAFVLLGLGVFSGIGMAALPSVRETIPFRQWLSDLRILGAAALWLTVALTLVAIRWRLVKMKTTAYLTLGILLLLIMGIISRAMLQGVHDISVSKSSETHSKLQATP